MLSQDWGYKAAIGHYDFDDRRLNGWIDEFTMFDYPLKEDQVFQLIGKLRCSANTTEISGVTQSQLDAFKYQGFTMKRHAPETNTEDIKGQISGGIKQRLKRIKKVPKIVI